MSTRVEPDPLAPPLAMPGVLRRRIAWIRAAALVRLDLERNAPP
jgi:hypothetical protein